MAQQTSNNDPAALSPNGYSERPLPQYTGGDIDPTTGNVIPVSKASYATPSPAVPQTNLGNQHSGPNATTAALESAGLSLLANAGGKVLGDKLSVSKGSAGTNPLNGPQGGDNSTGAGSRQDSGSGDIPGLNPPSGDVSQGSNALNSGSSGVSSGDPSLASAPAGDVSPQPTPSAPSSGGYYEPFSTGGDSGDSVICTELHRQGLLDGITFEADRQFGAWVQSTHPHVYAGYYAWARHFVRLMRVSPAFTIFVRLLAYPWARYLAVQMGQQTEASWFGMVVFHVGWALCATIGTAMAALASFKRRTV